MLFNRGTMLASTFTRVFAVTGKPPKWVYPQPWRPFIQLSSLCLSLSPSRGHSSTSPQKLTMSCTG